MAGAASCNLFTIKTLPKLSPPTASHAQLPPPASVAFPWPSAKKEAPVLLLRAQRSPFVVRAVGDDEEKEKEPEAGAEGTAGSVAVAEEGAAEVTEIGELKKKLAEALYGTDRGLKASSETRAEVVELITQLEAKNPTPAPTEALALLNGKWNLAYTSFSQLFPLLGSGRLPELVKVEEISQTIDSEAFTVQNSVKFAGPLATTSVTTNAKFEVRSPKRVQIKFQEGIIGTPQLTDSIVIPDKVEFLGQNIDFSPLKGVITSIENSYSSVAKTISGQPPIKIPISSNTAESWLLTTYLDDELRISRGDGGSVFVFTKDGSSLLN
ncbi:putative plastid-lipid-associated protein 2, chloroplastic [Iris pallida]|uniref:Plastid-lipid-associated protein 2, chloroplastic n=1 Tax=Iris pallida TaxID=29817 RepID=A0AAX6GNU4_IRIPA|nr:putative plastid-lipid-associated protein 2, chloroplastic [Iris pallida]KAJ6841607.1 putative plastid-lipid-associated protein 2, chloroplastic [Iris pallida]